MDDATRTILDRHAPRWETPASRWEDGLLLGGAAAGAVIWGDGDPLIVNVDHQSFWDRTGFTPSPDGHTWSAFRRAIEGESGAWDEQGWPLRATSGGRVEQCSRMPPSRIELRFAGGARVESMTLDLRAAVGEAVVGDAVVHASTYMGTGVTHISVDGGVPDVRVVFFRDVAYRGLPPRLAARYGDTVPDTTLTPQRFFDGKGYPPADTGESEGVRFAAQRMPDGGSAAIAWAVDERDTGADVWCALAYARDGATAAHDAVALLRKVRADPGPARRRHDDWWDAHWSASWVSVPDTRLESLYVLEAYKLGCCMGDGAPATGLAGPWCPDGQMPAWGADYHFNVNVQMTYWPVHAGNRPHLADGLVGYVEGARPEFARYCRDFLQRDGEFVPTSCDVDGRSRFDWPIVAFSGCNGPWLAHVLWQHWEYTGDERFLHERMLPFLEAVAAPVLAELEAHADGTLHLPFSYAPEYPLPDGVAPYGPDSVTDLALVRWMLETLVASGRGDLQDTLRCLAAFPSDPSPGALGGLTGAGYGGLRVRGDVAFDHSHRHHCHLMPIHPMLQLRIDGTREERALVRESVRNWIWRGQGEWVGFSFPWAASICAHAGEADLARTFLLHYVDHWVTANGFSLQAPVDRSSPSVWADMDGFMRGAVTLESGFGAVSAVHDMLLQSHDGVIRLFPAVPASWHDASFRHLRARGAVLVSAAWRDDAFACAELEALRDASFALRLPAGTGDVRVVVDGDDVGDQTSVHLRAGQRAVVAHAGHDAVEPVAAREWECGWFGTKRRR